MDGKSVPRSKKIVTKELFDFVYRPGVFLIKMKRPQRNKVCLCPGFIPVIHLPVSPKLKFNYAKSSVVGEKTELWNLSTLCNRPVGKESLCCQQWHHSLVHARHRTAGRRFCSVTSRKGRAFSWWGGCRGFSFFFLDIISVSLSRQDDITSSLSLCFSARGSFSSQMLA